MSKIKRLYEDICFYIDDHYDDDEIAMVLGIDEKLVKEARETYKEQEGDKDANKLYFQNQN